LSRVETVPVPPVPRPLVKVTVVKLGINNPYGIITGNIAPGVDGPKEPETIVQRCVPVKYGDTEIFEEPSGALMLKVLFDVLLVTQAAPQGCAAPT